jgi:hypothetical protein
MPFLERTAAIRLFKRHHTHFNATFWSYAAARHHAYAATKASVPADPASSIFPYAANNRRLNVDLGVWAENFEDFDRWSRHASVLAIAGYLEMFLAQICSAALESCPAIIFGGAREVDGLALLKARASYGFFSHVEPIVRGEWGARVSAYKRLFGACPFESRVSELERLRRVRNNAGHCFGRDIERLQRAESAIVERLERISDDRLVKFLVLAEEVATVVERQLGPAFVGAYELLRLYHTSRARIHAGVGRRERADVFSKIVNDTIGSPCGKDYGEALIAAYENA